MKISIALTTYNGSRFLALQLDSLVKQRRLPDEIIVCDDNSKDETCDILELFKINAPFLVKIFKNTKTLGHTKNFEKAISNCGGDIIALCDQDDIWYPEKLLCLERVFMNSNAIGLAFSDSDLIDEEGNKINLSVWNRLGFDLSKQSKMKNDAFGLLLHGPCITGMSMMFRSDLRSKILPIPEEWHHDAWIALLVSLLGKIEPVSDRLNAYRVHPKQKTYIPMKAKKERSSRDLRASRYLDGAHRYEQAKARFLKIENCRHSNNTLSRLDGKIELMKSRSKVYSTYLWWPTVLYQYILGRYTHYGSGLRGAIGDLLLLGKPTSNDY